MSGYKSKSRWFDNVCLDLSINYATLSLKTSLPDGMSGLAGTLNVLSTDRENKERGKATLNDWQRNMVTEFHVAKMNGHPVGFIADSRITHATPAGMWASSADRNYEASNGFTVTSTMATPAGLNPPIADQYLFSGYGLPDVVLGGGERAFCYGESCVHQKSSRVSSSSDKGIPVDLVAKAKVVFGDKIVFVYNEEELKAATTPAEIAKFESGERIALFGFFDDSSLDPSLFRDVVAGDERYTLYKALTEAAEKYMKEEDDKLIAKGEPAMYTQRRENNLALLNVMGSSATTQPSLVEMTEAAVKVLQARSKYLTKLHGSKKPYFLMPEASQIDWWMHSSDYTLAADEVFMLEKSVDMAESLTKGQATILVTADHSHGLASGGYFARTKWWNEITPWGEEAGMTGTPQYGVIYGSGNLHHPTKDSDMMYGPKLRPYTAESTMTKQVQDKLYEWGIKPTELEYDGLTKHQDMILTTLAAELDAAGKVALMAAANKTGGAGRMIGVVGNPNIPKMVAMAPGFKAPSVFYSRGGSHGGSEVPLYCKGPGDACDPVQMHKGTITQGFIAQYMRCAGRLDKYTTNKDDVTKALMNTFYLQQKILGLKYTDTTYKYHKMDSMNNTMEAATDAFKQEVEADVAAAGTAVPAFDVVASAKAVSPNEFAYPKANAANAFY